MGQAAGNFYEKYHLLIALVTDVHISEIGESNLVQLYILSDKTCEKVRQASQIMWCARLKTIVEIRASQKMEQAIEMKSALKTATKLYASTHNSELKAILDRAELCFHKWGDTSDYKPLMEKCTDVLLTLF